MTKPEQPRRPKGTPAGGQWAPLSRPEAATPRLDPFDDIGEVEAALENGRLDGDQVRALLHPSRPLLVRIAAATAGYVNTWQLAVRDNHPFVRAGAWLSFDTPEEVLEGLLADPATRGFSRLLVGV